MTVRYLKKGNVAGFIRILLRFMLYYIFFCDYSIFKNTGQFTRMNERSTNQYRKKKTYRVTGKKFFGTFGKDNAYELDS